MTRGGWRTERSSTGNGAAAASRRPSTCAPARRSATGWSGSSGSNPDLGLVEGVRAVAASEGNAGVIEIATQDEVGLGTDAVKAITPATLAKALEAYAPLESPALTGRPTAPTPARPAAST